MRKKVITLVLASSLVLSATVAAFANPGKVNGSNKVPPGQSKKTVTEQVYKTKQVGPPAFVRAKHIEKFTFIDGNRIKVKGKHINFDVPPVIKVGRTLIPVRAVTMGLGAQVDWHPNEVLDEDGIVIYEEGTIVITRGDVEIKLVLGSEEVYINGDLVIIDVSAGLINNRTFVPLRFISEILGDKVTYNDETGEIEIGDEEEAEGAVATTEELAGELEGDGTDTQEAIDAAQEAHDTAAGLVDELEVGAEKTALGERLAAVQELIDDAQDAPSIEEITEE